MGFSLVILATAALITSFVPFLNWIALVVALPLAVAGAISSYNAGRRLGAQSVDKAAKWISLGILLLVILRLAIMNW